MDNPTLQRLETQLKKSLHCGDCTALRLLIWERPAQSAVFGESPPQHAVTGEQCWYAVHCDYFRRRIEAPDQLKRCGAHQKKKDG